MADASQGPSTSCFVTDPRDAAASLSRARFSGKSSQSQIRVGTVIGLNQSCDTFSQWGEKGFLSLMRRKQSYFLPENVDVSGGKKAAILWPRGRKLEDSNNARESRAEKYRGKPLATLRCWTSQPTSHHPSLLRDLARRTSLFFEMIWVATKGRLPPTPATLYVWTRVAGFLWPYTTILASNLSRYLWTWR